MPPPLATQTSAELMARAPIARRTLHEEVTNRVRDMVIEGRLQPGTRIDETQLGQALGVSRTPLREALKTLSSEGLLELVPQRGAVVREFSLQDVTGIFEVTKAPEQLAGRAACERGTDKQIAEVRRLHDKMMHRYRRRERLAFYELNDTIHVAIIAMAENPTLSEMHGILQARSKRKRHIGNRAPEKRAGAVRDHEEIIAALQARDADRLVAILGAHRDNALVRVRNMF